MTWQEVVKNDSIADKVLKNMVRIFYEKARLDDKIKRIRIDRNNSTITLIVFPKMTSLFLGRGNKTLNALEERLKRWKVNIEE
tara:strand:- start:194 stop:442 length:249 start_codon:yes stop_codon:yes gene_type:complete